MKSTDSTAQYLNTQWRDHLPGHLGIVITQALPDEVQAELDVTARVSAPDGHLHAGSILALAVHAAGCGCALDLPTGIGGFSTLELKVNYLSAAHSGKVACSAQRIHSGRTTQIWDVKVTQAESSKVLALVRCTQLLLAARS